MSNYKFGANSLPFVFLAIFVILFIYDSALEQEERVPEVISKTLSLNNNNSPGESSGVINIDSANIVGCSGSTGAEGTYRVPCNRYFVLFGIGMFFEFRVSFSNSR